MDRDQLHALPLCEKIDLVEWLWDDIGASSEPLVVPNWAQAEAKKRLAEMKANPGSGVTAQEVWRRVDESRG